MAEEDQGDTDIWTDIRLGHKALRDTLTTVFKVDGGSTGAFNSRLKRTIALLDPEDRIPDQRSQNRRYGLAEILEISLCLQMQRGHISQSACADFVRRERSTLLEAWKRIFVKSDGYVLEIPLDAFREPASALGAASLSNDAYTFGRAPGSQTNLPVIRIDLGRIAENTLDTLEGRS